MGSRSSMSQWPANQNSSFIILPVVKRCEVMGQKQASWMTLKHTALLQLQQDQPEQKFSQNLSTTEDVIFPQQEVRNIIDQRLKIPINTECVFQQHFQWNDLNLKNSLSASSGLSCSSSSKEIIGVDVKQNPDFFTSFRAQLSTSFLVTTMWVFTPLVVFSALNSLRMVSRSRVSCE